VKVEPKMTTPSEDNALKPASGEAPQKRGRRAPLAARAAEVHDRMTIFVVRALFFVIAGGIGFYCSILSQGRIDPVFSTLSGCGIALMVILGEAYFSKAPIRTISAITFGLIIGLVMSVVFQPVLELIVQFQPEMKPQEREGLMKILNLISTTIFSFFGVTLLLQTKGDFKFIIPFVEFRKEVKGHSPLVLDTSAIIDGRIQALLATGVLDQRLVVPKFVCDELQTIADSPDRSRRERGRRGMDMLDQVCREYGAEILERSAPPGVDVDAALLEVVAEAAGKLVTTDFNLQKRAKLQGIMVINVNDLASALKPAIVPGEVLRVRLLREGEDPGQAVGFLNDGTMVVVESASRRIGQEVTIEVTSAIQTSAGKMIFGRLRRSGRNGRDDRGSRGGRRDERPEIRDDSDRSGRYTTRR